MSVPLRLKPLPTPKPHVPWWGWVFAGACFLIPIISLGGGIPAAIGGGGGFGCLAAARDSKRSVSARVGICAAVTIGCWVLFVAFVVAAATFLVRPTDTP